MLYAHTHVNNICLRYVTLHVTYSKESAQNVHAISTEKH